MNLGRKKRWELKEKMCLKINKEALFSTSLLNWQFLKFNKRFVGEMQSWDQAAACLKYFEKHSVASFTVSMPSTSSFDSMTLNHFSSCRIRVIKSMASSSRSSLKCVVSQICDGGTLAIQLDMIIILSCKYMYLGFNYSSDITLQKRETSTLYLRELFFIIAVARQLLKRGV